MGYPLSKVMRGLISFLALIVLGIAACHPWRAAGTSVKAGTVGSVGSSRVAQTENITQPSPERKTDGSLVVGNGVIRYFFASHDLVLPRRKFIAWIEQSAYAVAHYYGRFPVDELHLVLVPVPGRGVKTGKAYGGETAAINIVVGVESTESDLEEDWIMVHEMVHLAFPSMSRRHDWIAEGLATYVESIARTNVGHLSPEFVWQGFVRGMPHGLPRPGDRGLDYTPTWGRTYWGGALFCLLADIDIRARTGNRLGLQDALRAILQSGANITREMLITEVLKIGDDAIGSPVLMALYDRMKATPVDVDLDRLWQRLGVEVRGKTIVLHDDAPLASTRQRITAVTYSAL